MTYPPLRAGKLGGHINPAFGSFFFRYAFAVCCTTGSCSAFGSILNLDPNRASDFDLLSQLASEVALDINTTVGYDAGPAFVPDLYQIVSHKHVNELKPCAVSTIRNLHGYRRSAAKRTENEFGQLISVAISVAHVRAPACRTTENNRTMFAPPGGRRKQPPWGPGRLPANPIAAGQL
ncbi:hypothetical protein EVAR_82685_1 [Eumeta japonica]|uniref:Uncharacterized protein n=1 Tax=Eumeta variegata TaxID=151549 RepID=A0A4C1VB68_EUMVA|nr:hypothetical protein EVAR_82685_1 [Eumeta japonica]